ncbi:MAG TPA: hypothetical protein IAB57_02515 [Candidatus Fimivivens faecavium]|nr:hypothetical protein [Candidatus Fimivivens faecavium]
MIRKRRYDPENGIITAGCPNAAAFIAADTGEKGCRIDIGRIDEEQARLPAKRLGLHRLRHRAGVFQYPRKDRAPDRRARGACPRAG